MYFVCSTQWQFSLSWNFSYYNLIELYFHNLLTINLNLYSIGYSWPLELTHVSWTSAQSGFLGGSCNIFPSCVSILSLHERVNLNRLEFCLVLGLSQIPLQWGWRSGMLSLSDGDAESPVPRQPLWCDADRLWVAEPAAVRLPDLIHGSPVLSLLSCKEIRNLEIWGRGGSGGQGLPAGGLGRHAAGQVGWQIALTL